MKIDWRVSATAAGSAFLLSMLIGVIGSVAFGILILRAVVAAVVFGAGAIGVTILVDRFLPELRREPAASSDTSVGGSVDIVVDGDEEVDVIEAGVEQIDPEQSAEMRDGAMEDLGDSESQSVDDSDVEEVEEITSADDLPTVEPIPSGFSDMPLGGAPAKDSPVSGEDPELMARAIRSVLKREG